MAGLKKQLDIIKQLREIHLEAYEAFTAFEIIQEQRAPNHVGELAAENAQALGRYKGFMNIAERALNYDFLMLVSILFIPDRQSASLPKILNIVEQNPVTTNDYVDLYKDEPERLTGLENYTGITSKELKEMKNELAGIDPTVQVLREHRNQVLAHRDITSITPGNLTYADIYELLQCGDRILQKLTSGLDKSSTSYALIERDTKEHTTKLIHLLHNKYKKEDAA